MSAIVVATPKTLRVPTPNEGQGKGLFSTDPAGTDNTPEPVRSVKDSVSRMDLEDKEYHTAKKVRLSKDEEKSRSPSPAQPVRQKMEEPAYADAEPKKLTPRTVVAHGVRVVITRSWHPSLPVGKRGTVVRAHFESKHDVEWDGLMPPNNRGTINVGDTNWEVLKEVEITVTPPGGSSRLQRPTPAIPPEEDSASPRSADSQITSPINSSRWSTSSNSPAPQATIPTALVFDYDDTLLPSSWLHQNKLRIDDSPVDEYSRERLEEHAECVIELLELALNYVGVGNVIILTNAERGWIDLSAEKFLPSCVPYLRRCHIMSARSTYEYLARPNGLSTYMSPQCWKPLAFHYLLQNYFQCPIEMTFKSKDWSKMPGEEDLQLHEIQTPNAPKQRRGIYEAQRKLETPGNDLLDEGTSASAAMFSGAVPDAEEQSLYWSTTAADSISFQIDQQLNEDGRIAPSVVRKAIKQVISFGDSDSERTAVKAVCKHMPKTICKSIKLQQKPSVGQLLKEVQLLINEWSQIVDPETDMDLILQATPSSEASTPRGSEQD